MYRKLSVLFLALILLFLLSGCPGNGAAPDGVITEDDITTTTTWTEGTVYVIGENGIYVSATLIIEAGTIVKFSGTGSGLTLSSGGTIVANGIAAAPVVFTSYKDDTQGGDTNGDGDATSPARADWERILTNGENGSTFDYCEFYYGGNSTNSATLEIDTGSVATVTNCLFVNNSGNDSSGWYGALDATTAGAGTVIADNIFYNNIRPLSISTAFDLDDSNTFHNPDDATQTNQFNGIPAYDNMDQKDHLSWAETEVAYIIDDNDWYIDTSDTLTLADNVVIKFRSGGELTVNDGVGAVINYEGTGVAFTSYKDDAWKGDTNGDGTATSATAGDWEGIYDNSAVTPPYYFTWSSIHYDATH